MAKSIKTDIHINASPEKVWAVLSNFTEYPEWNPFITSIAGPAAEGQKISVHIIPPGMKGMSLKPKVLDFKPGKLFRWTGHLGIPGIFDGEHYFEIADLGNGSCTFIQGENFKGLLVPFLNNMLDKNTLDGFRLMNEQLKQRAEQA